MSIFLSDLLLYCIRALILNFNFLMLLMTRYNRFLKSLGDYLALARAGDEVQVVLL